MEVDAFVDTAQNIIVAKTVRCNEKGFIFINNAVSKNFWFNWTGGDASEIIEGKGFTVTFF